MKPLVLMISDDARHSDSLRRVLHGGDGTLRQADTVPLALARLAGGGVSSLVLDLSRTGAGEEALQRVRALRTAAPDVPLYLWTEQGGRPAAVEGGAQGWVNADMPAAELHRMLFGERPEPAPAVSAPAPEPLPRGGGPAMIVSVLGAKGGVGTTTVAMNVAACLAARGRVILAEIRPGFGSLFAHFQPGRLVRGLVMGAERRPFAPSTLWPVPSVPGMRICFGPQRASDCGELSAAQAMETLLALAGEADFVVLDLPPELSAANRVLLETSQYLALTLTPTAACAVQARQMVEGIQDLPRTPASIGLVPVTRSPEGVYLSMPELEGALQMPFYRAVPPAPELSAHGERSHMPMMLCDPESLAADSFHAIAQTVHGHAAVARRA